MSSTLGTLLTFLLAPLSGFVLFDRSAPDGATRVVRRIDGERGARTLLLRDAEPPLDLGFEFFPAGWSEDGARILGYRLIEDGHELLAARPEARDRAGVPREWSGGAGEFDAVLADAVRESRTRALAAPSGCPGRIICIDPGHGGPGAAQWNGVNGDGAGSHGPTGLTEQWVNLRVGRILFDRLNADPRFEGSFLTRDAESQALSLADRVLAAAAGGAELLLSIHHNGLPAGAANRTETYYCRENPGCTDEASWKLPARLSHDRLVDAFGYGGLGAREDSSGTGRFHFYVLRHSPCISTLTEASNLNGDHHEEDLFGRDPEDAHARAEALALHQALIEQFGYPTGVDEGDAGLVPLPGPLQRFDARFSADGGAVVIEWAAPGPLLLDVALFDLRGRRLGRLAPLHGPGAGEARLQPAGVGRAGLPTGIYWLVATDAGTILARRRLIRAR